MDYRKYYHLENYLLGEVSNGFKDSGELSAFDFHCILIWKANRAKNRHIERLRRGGRQTYAESIASLVAALTKCPTPKERLCGGDGTVIADLDYPSLAQGKAIVGDAQCASCGLIIFGKERYLGECLFKDQAVAKQDAIFKEKRESWFPEDGIRKDKYCLECRGRLPLHYTTCSKYSDSAPGVAE